MKTFAALALMMLTLSACNTVAGFGQDVRKAGAAIQNVAD